MKKASIVVTKDYMQDRLFDLSNPVLNRDNCLYPFFLLKQKFADKGYDLKTHDLHSPSESEIILYNEMPKPFSLGIKKENSYLLIFESELIRPDNWDREKHKSFKKIFTWNDDLIDGTKYIKFNFPNSLKITAPGLDKRKKLATLISGNKTSSHPKELYRERVKTIKWFEKNHPSKFDYYGVGWDFKWDLRWQKVFRKLKLLNFIPKNDSVCFKGKVASKHEALQKYKFAICYENAKEINGYITEKIFDCFFAGCVPVYWGPDNSTKFIPENCFIDRRRFKTHEELFTFLTNMSEENYLQYQNNINDFLNSERFSVFSDEFFAENIIRNIFEK